MGTGGLLCCLVARRPGRVRRDGRHRLALAERGWGAAESATGPGSGRRKPNRSGEKTAASECCWSTVVASRCRSSWPPPIAMMSLSSSQPSTAWWCAGRASARARSNICAPTPLLGVPPPTRRFGVADTFLMFVHAARASDQEASSAATLGGRGGSLLVQSLPQAAGGLREDPPLLPRPLHARRRHHLLPSRADARQYYLRINS